ncbi:MAG: hypothetical protein JWN86_593 [Planctomycetota bacterium]|nr:hypothetical protein [Planctomycetota bacterium]
MTIKTKPLAEVTSHAIEVLTRELGPADAIRFFSPFGTGSGDDTSERDALFGHLTLGEIQSRAGPRRGGLSDDVPTDP